MTPAPPHYSHFRDEKLRLRLAFSLYGFGMIGLYLNHSDFLAHTLLECLAWVAQSLAHFIFYKINMGVPALHRNGVQTF